LYNIGFFQSLLKNQFSIQVISRLYQYRVSHRGALFVGCFFITMTLLSPQVFARTCPADHIDETVEVSKVVDGDTLRLKDGRLVRFIGINTPELARKGNPAEPLAKKARQTLESIIEKSSYTVGLRIGVERMDRYGRTLAHVYLTNGVSVEARMLSTGMAAQIVVPPNVWNVECLNFPRRPGEGDREGVAVRVSRKDLDYFKVWDPRNLKGKQVVVRGWVYPYKKQLVMQLRHPLALEIKPDER